jgi:hypothetical protein
MAVSLIVSRMENQIAQWSGASDQRLIFLSCYKMMTQNMDAAITRAEFVDPVWVDRLLERFADYYFIALHSYDENPRSAPEVWQIAHSFSRNPKAWALQKLLLGVNAHINYDLVLTLNELLKPEWDRLSPTQRNERYSDYTYVNDIIGSTIDAVQDQVIEPAMPVMDLFDRLLGREDERLISKLLSQWREQVWAAAMGLLGTRTADEYSRLVRQVEAKCLKHARIILLTDLPTWFG